METINAAVYETHGNPAEVLHVESQRWPTPGAGEVIVKMRAAPVNPADLNQIEGKYPVRAQLPATPGFEGAGIIADVDRDVTNVAAGALVILPHNIGTWRDAVAVKADELVVVRSEEHTSELQSHSDLVCRLLLEKKNQEKMI